MEYAASDPTGSRETAPLRAGVVFFALGALQAGAAVAYGGGWWFFAWSAVAFFVVGAAYVTASPGLLGKRPDGTLHGPHVVVLLPYFSLVWARWWLTSRLTREPPWSEVRPGLFFGRRPAVGQLPPSVELVVDLTAELRRAEGVGNVAEYICVPTLDYEAPPPAALAAVVPRVASSRAPVYIHCAFGHGRSAVLTAAVLIRRGVASGVDEALSQLKAVRPGVGFSRSQRALLETIQGTSSP